MEVMFETCCGVDGQEKSIVSCIPDGSLDNNHPKKYIQSFGMSTPQFRVALRMA